MEPFLAKLAVYSSSGFVNRVVTLFTRLSSLLNSTPWMAFVMLSIAVGTFYLWRSIDSNKFGGRLNARSSESECFSEIQLNEFKNEWLFRYGSSYQTILNKWIDSVNQELSKHQTAPTFLIHSVELKPLLQLTPLEGHFVNHQNQQISTIICSLRFPLLILKCYLNLEDKWPSLPVLLSITDFQSNLHSYITHRKLEITSLTMTFLPHPDFVVYVEDFHSSQIQELQMRLQQALVKCRIEWIPGSTECGTSRHPTTAVSEETGISRQMFELIGDSRKLSSPDGSSNSENEDTHKFAPLDTAPLNNASMLDLTPIPKTTNSPIFELVDRDLHSGSVGHQTSEVLINARMHWKSCCLPRNEAEHHVVVPYNEMIKKSVVEKQLPKRHHSALVRSASYYGEHHSSRMHPMTESWSSQSPTLPSSSGEIPHASPDFPPSLAWKEPHSQPVDTSTAHPEVSHVNKYDSTVQRLCRKLLVNVVNAEGLIFKGASTAYCVVELDEPYQRHTTHCSSSVQLFWDQHLLFDLNSNSKKIAIEVFELLKRKKSVSKGRSELVLSSLIGGPTETMDASQRETSDFRLRLPLSTRAPAVLLDSTTQALSLSSSTHADLSGAQSEPIVTVEFHFMEKAVDEPPFRRAAEMRSPASVQRALSSRSGFLQSTGGRESPTLGSPLLGSTMAHSTSFDITSSPGVQTGLDAHLSGPLSVTPELPETRAEKTCTSNARHISQFSSPNYPRRTNLTQMKSAKWTSLSSDFLHNRSKEDVGSVSDDSASLSIKGKPPSPLVLDQPGATDRSSAPMSPAGQTDGSRLDHRLRRSHIIGSEEPTDISHRVLLPYGDLDFHSTKQHHVVSDSSGSVPSSRSHSLAERFRSSRLLGTSSLRSGKRNSGDGAASSSPSSLALLGPSRQLAGVVAGLSALPADSESSPISAASIAAALAVAGATGSWQEVGDNGKDDKLEDSLKASTSYEPPTHHIPPPALVAVGKPGTFAALNQPRRSDASNMGLFRLFRHKKKRFRSVGAEKLFYLEHAGDFDTISTEGYYRIVQDNETSSPP